MKASTQLKVGYGVGAVGKDMVYSLVSGFLMYYCNTVFGISTAFIGVLLMVARIFDAFNDPFMGVVVGKTKSRYGKFRPWLLVGTLLNAVVLYFMFAIPGSMQGTSLLVYVSVSYLLWGITYTMMDIPYWSMIPSITEPGKDRESMSVIARSCAGFGFAVPTALTMLFVGMLGSGDDREGFRLFALIVAVIFVLAITVTVLFVKEKNDAELETPTVRQMFRALIENDQALFIVITIVVFNASLYITQNLALYFFKFDIGNEALFGVFGTVGGAAQILAMLALPALRKKMSKQTIFVGSILLAIAGYVYLFLLGTFGITNLILLSIAAIIIFAGFGLATVLTTVFLADTVDYGEWKSHQRNDSVVFSLQTFVVKLASAISALIAGIGLDMIGLQTEAATQSASTLLGMRLLMTVVPILGLVCAIAIFRKKYTLTDEKLTQMMQQVKERNA